jgi:hypothetical protein
MTTTINQLLTNWTITKKTKSIYDGVKCRERPNFSKLYGYMKTNNATEPNLTSFGYEDDKTQLKKYIQNTNPTDKYINTSHSLPKGQKFNRTIPTSYLSMSVMRRTLRHTLCNGIYIDIDMKNAQPTIITVIAKNNNYNKLVRLNDYVENRELYLQRVMTTHKVDRTTAKALFITMITGGTYEGWIVKHTPNTKDKMLENENIYKIQDELDNVRELVFSNNPKIVAEVKKEQPTYTLPEIKKSVFSKWYMTIERNIQESAISYLVEYKDFELSNIIPSQDGFMILEDTAYPTILEDIYNHINTIFNIPVEFVVKPFDEVIIDCPTGIPPTSKNWDNILCEKGLGDETTKLYGEYFKRVNGLFYVYKHGKWYDETDKSSRFMTTKYISEDLYNAVYKDIEEDLMDDTYKRSISKDLRKLTSNPTSIKNITHHLESNLPNEPVDFFDKKTHLLGFNNGVYNILTQEFRQHQYDDYITLTTGWDYFEPSYETEEETNLRETLISILDTIQSIPEQRDLLIQVLATGLDGYAYQNAIIFQGQGGNGKGLLAGLMSCMLGDYFYKPSASILKDMARANSASPEIMKLKNKRYIDIEEVGGVINATLLRNITGGGTLEGRNLYQKTTETFKLSSLLVLEINDAFELDGKPAQADYRRYKVLKFNTNFTDDETKIDKIINGIQYRKANPYYTTEDFKISIRPYLFDLLTSIYVKFYDPILLSIKFITPPLTRDDTNEYMGNLDISKGLFDASFRLTPDFTKTLSLKYIYDTIKASSIYTELSINKKALYGQNTIYKYVRELVNAPKHTSKKAEMIMGIEILDPDTFNYADEEV